MKSKRLLSVAAVCGTCVVVYGKQHTDGARYMACCEYLAVLMLGARYVWISGTCGFGRT
jgi:hypothetical protein